MERTVPASKRSDRDGFTLTELLVAMAIFTILMSGLATMFNAAVTSARQGYASIDAYENARAAMTTIDRDLSGAFVSSEFGELYNFYGRPDGFMFVGAMDGGRLGRVTYAFHPEAAKSDFTTTISLQWGEVRENILRQYRRKAWEEGLTGTPALNFAHNALVDFDAAYPQPIPPVTVPPTPPGEVLVELNVRIETESLIRFEEIGVTDLDAFDMRIDAISTIPPPSGAWTGIVDLTWNDLYVDPVNPSLDATVIASDDQYDQFEFLLGALDPTPLTGSADDLRNVYADIAANDGWWHPLSGDRLYLRVLGRDTFDTLLRARKREFWVRMLSGEDLGVLDLMPDKSNNVWGFWHDEGLGLINPVEPGNPLDHRTVNEYVVADGIIARAVVLDANGDELSHPVDPTRLDPNYWLDALDADVKFSYSDGKNEAVNYFNASENLANLADLGDEVPNIPSLLKTGVFTQGDVIQADDALAYDQLAADRITQRNMGSPLLPRLPAVVTPELWVTRSKTRPGAPGFRRRFVQSIQVPAASGRAPRSVIAQSPGQSF